MYMAVDTFLRYFRVHSIFVSPTPYHILLEKLIFPLVLGLGL